jgi:uncharacterized protein YqjF (DUF2071 family)
VTAEAAAKPFLTAQWRDLVMLNWPVDASLLAPLVPAGTELDLFEGRGYASLVAFRFLDTRVRGVPIPGHRDFEEINLRFYVKRSAGSETRRGVVFIKEIVPRAAIAFVARVLYGEPYVALPTASEVRADAAGKTAGYSWRQGELTHSLSIECGPESAVPAPDTCEAFIAEHYWGYTARRDGATSEYRVAHPSWAVRAAKAVACKIDAERLYGRELGRALSAPPDFAFLAEGSAIEVYPGRALT